jgi:hypothetical protein
MPHPPAPERAALSSRTRRFCLYTFIISSQSLIGLFQFTDLPHGIVESCCQLGFTFTQLFIQRAIF